VLEHDPEKWKTVFLASVCAEIMFNLKRELGGMPREEDV